MHHSVYKKVKTTILKEEQSMRGVHNEPLEFLIQNRVLPVQQRAQSQCWMQKLMHRLQTSPHYDLQGNNLRYFYFFEELPILQLRSRQVNKPQVPTNRQSVKLIP